MSYDPKFPALLLCPKGKTPNMYLVYGNTQMYYRCKCACISPPAPRKQPETFRGRIEEYRMAMSEWNLACGRGYVGRYLTDRKPFKVKPVLHQKASLADCSVSVKVVIKAVSSGTTGVTLDPS